VKACRNPRQGHPCPARRPLGVIENKGPIVPRTGPAGKCSVSLPHLGWTTADALPA
jgi:uncharacterized protein